MKLGCKKDTLCKNINKGFCCLECSNFNSCEEPCMPLLNGETNKENILKYCDNAIEIIS